MLRRCALAVSQAPKTFFSVDTLLESFAHVPASSTLPAMSTQAANSSRSRPSPIFRPLEVSMPSSINELIPPLEARSPGPESVRVGMIGVKVGMVSEWDEYGVLTPFTVLWFDENQVTQVKAPPFDCTTALQVGCGSKKAKRLHIAQQQTFLKNDLPFKSKLTEFKVSPDALLPIGTHLTAAHFVAGQHVDIVAVTRGKGFQGVMKRWGFKGQPATHGHSLSHRSPGSIGQQGYARVLPGKKMAGRMGGKQRTQLNCWVYRIDPKRNLMWIKGTVQGAQGAFVYVRDARRKVPGELPDLPFPTHVGELPEVTQAKPKKNFYDDYRQ